MYTERLQLSPVQPSIVQIRAVVRDGAGRRRDWDETLAPSLCQVKLSLAHPPTAHVTASHAVSSYRHDMYGVHSKLTYKGVAWLRPRARISLVGFGQASQGKRHLLVLLQDHMYLFSTTTYVRRSHKPQTQMKRRSAVAYCCVGPMSKKAHSDR